MTKNNPNIAYWDELAEIHETSEFYDVEAFLAGESATSLQKIELDALGDVQGKSMLHLQCHFGMDSLSWARLGAKVIGVDFSSKAIEIANKLKDKTGLEARFIKSDINSLPDKLNEKFDIVFTSYGVLAWLQDLNKWAEVISHFLAPGGTFFIVDHHPLAFVLHEKSTPEDMKIGYSYFENETLTFTDEYSYASGEKKIKPIAHNEWHHRIEEIINPLIAAGLTITSFNEHKEGMFQQFPWMTRKVDKYWHSPQDALAMPMLFSIKATRPF